MSTTIPNIARIGPMSLQAPAGAATVLVPLDGSEHALAALPPARVIAEVEGHALHLAHISEGVVPIRELVNRLGLPPEAVRGSVINHASGDAAAGIVRLCHEQQSRYVVMSTHAGHPQVAGALGHVAKEVVCTSPCPVLLVPPARGQQPYSLRRVLLPHDGTPTTTAAAAPAIELAHRAGAEVLVLHVAAAHVSPPQEPGSLTTPRYVDQGHYEWPAWAHEFLERVCPPPGALSRLRLAAATDATGAQITQFARDYRADLIVLDWHGSWEVEHAEITKGVLREALCPVMMIRVAECT